MQDIWVHKYHTLAVLQNSGHQNCGDVVNIMTMIQYNFNPHPMVFSECSVLVPLDSSLFDIAAAKGMGDEEYQLSRFTGQWSSRPLVV